MTSLDDDSEATLSVGSSDARIVGKHYEYDSVSAAQTKRYYANGTLLATRTGTTLTYVQGDHLGSSSTLTNSSGAVVSRERYSAFGERRRTSDKVLTDQLYTGQRLNALSGLYHYSDGGSAGRFYDPLLARFIMADPLLPHLASQGLNRYSATYNNPLRYKDPNGHDPSDVINGLNEFAQGVVAQVGYNNGTLVPGAQAGLARQPGESGAMTAGRVVGDVVSIGQGVVEAGVGGGAIGGGVAACGTGVLCAAGAPAMVAGAAVAVHGATTAATAAGQLGDKIGIVMSQRGGGESPISAVVPPGPGTRGQLRANMQRAGITPSEGMTSPQAHHNLPFKHRGWFAGQGRGINVNEARWGRWVEGTPPGPHQNWTHAYEGAWDTFILNNPNATYDDVVVELNRLLGTGQFPSQ